MRIDKDMIKEEVVLDMNRSLIEISRLQIIKEDPLIDMKEEATLGIDIEDDHGLAVGKIERDIKENTVEVQVIQIVEVVVITEGGEGVQVIIIMIEGSQKPLKSKVL